MIEMVAHPTKLGGIRFRRVADAARAANGRLLVNRPMEVLLECLRGAPDSAQPGVPWSYVPLLDALFDDPVAVPVDAHGNAVNSPPDGSKYRGLRYEQAATILYGD